MITEKILGGIVGAENVSSRKDVLEGFGKDMSFVNTVMPELVVRPGTAADVESIVNLARDTGTPLVPVSSGPPHFRGDSVPSVGGAVIVDLSGMKKIIRVDRLNRVAMCEPGVTFDSLIAAAKKEGLRLNLPLLPRKSKSVVGSLLEREPVVMPKYHWDIADPLNCVEVILGNGAKFRTGAAAGPGTLEEQWEAGGAQVEAAGPSTASWYRVIQGSQGSMGIVTWASIRCEIVPRLEAPYLIGSPDLDKIIEIARWLIRLRLVNECFVLNDASLAAIMAKKWPDDYRDIKETLPAWALFYNVAGYDYFPEDRVKGQELDILDICQRAVLEPAQALGKVSAFELLRAAQQPSGEPYWKLRPKGACQDIFFVTDYETIPALVDVMHDLAAGAGYPASDMGVYVQPLVQGSNYHCEFNLFYDPANPREAELVRALSAGAVNKLIAAGAFFSRPYGENTGTIMNKDAATVAALRKVKSILDPGHIMNPGKLCF
jgi:FAD/FMN-containing dehydrogenase